ncbi:hypothetical protein SORDD17_00535 [Streptococcus oralis]|uniref:Uncharacterized protein n=1 Tax=Streptococcus oralis TaxID=1303 RepID=A0A139RND9_STROR|nr:hypothetical protein [Streptococcus oralis]KXU16256.1 hypothetical protein SORDD17_00535 [Streptococcus oralis]
MTKNWKRTSGEQVGGVTNNVAIDREEFIKKFTESLGKGFYNYKP